MKTTATATRQQVEAALQAQGFIEVARGDWESAWATVNLDIAHAPDTAWVTTVYRPIKRQLTYVDVLVMFG